jgi:hypothetical protein
MKDKTFQNVTAASAEIKFASLSSEQILPSHKQRKVKKTGLHYESFIVPKRRHKNRVILEEEDEESE